MAQTLEEQIAERKQQARDRKIYEKGFLVADKLGEHEKKSDGNYDTIRHIFNDAGSSLKVHYELCQGDWDYKEGGYGYTRHSFDIIFNDKLVFSRDNWGNVDCYVPGAWEEKLDALYLKAQQVVAKEQAEVARKAAAEKAAAEKKETERKLAKEKAERAKWGLEDNAPHDLAAARQQSLKKEAPSKVKIVRRFDRHAKPVY